MGRMAVNPLAAAAVVSRSSFLPPSLGTLWSRNPERPADGPDRTGRAANTDVNCIPSRGKSQFCLESAMSERESEAALLPRAIIAGARSTQLAMQVIFVGRATDGDHASIFNHFAESGIRESAAVRFEC